MATKWPESVPVFTPDMILKDSFGYGKCRHCAAGWLGAIFSNDPGHWGDDCGEVGTPYAKARDQLCKLAGIDEPTLEISKWNDDLATKEQIADTLNKTMRRLGYTEIVEVDA
jgi:hypothetical protein